MRVLISAALLGVLAAPAIAQKKPPMERPPVLTTVVQCRAIADPQQRLACYDRSVAALDAAQVNGDLVAISREQARKTRRSLFGLSLPDLGAFGADSDEAAVLDSTIKSASINANSKWTIVLPDGARWIQIDSRNVNFPPRAGQPVKIRRAALGSYMVSIDGQTGIRMRRVQ